MNEFFNNYVDFAALLLAVLVPLIFTIMFTRRAGKELRAVPAYLLFFGPAGILSFIFFHLFENSYHAIDQSVKGTFTYNFRFYSLILLGLVIAYLALLFLKACSSICLEQRKTSLSFFTTLLLIVLVSAPLIPLIPIAAVPIFCCAISCLGFPFVRRKQRHSTMVIKKEMELQHS